MERRGTCDGRMSEKVRKRKSCKACFRKLYLPKRLTFSYSYAIIKIVTFLCFFIHPVRCRTGKFIRIEGIYDEI